MSEENNTAVSYLVPYLWQPIPIYRGAQRIFCQYLYNLPLAVSVKKDPKMLEDTKTHWRRHTDFRKESLTQIITGLDKSIIVLQKQIEEIPWYDGDWFREESEPIYGLLFVAFQNHIIGSIKDFAGSTSEKEKYYRIGENWRHYPKTSIELIVGLANYSKLKTMIRFCIKELATF